MRKLIVVGALVLVSLGGTAPGYAVDLGSAPESHCVIDRTNGLFQEIMDTIEAWWYC